MMWTPSGSIVNLKKRAMLIHRIREFFISRDVWEVETPLLCHTSVTEPMIESMQAKIKIGRETHTYYLQTSPEYMMKRMLAANSGSIFQLTKAFRQDEIGRLHNPEFTMLEWYRVDYDHHDLMDEMDAFLQFILNSQPAKRYSYHDLFMTFLHIDPFTATIAELKNCVAEHHVDVNDDFNDRDTWLHLLLSHCIEPKIGFDAPCFLYDFPITQSALARIQPTNPPVASRFEVYINGIELANGFHELIDADEQRKRFEQNLIDRKAKGLPILPIDEHFLAALDAGLPDCAGVALGVDRLMMIALGAKSIQEVLTFDLQRV